MLGIGQSRSTRIAFMGGVSLRAVVLALLSVLVLAATAHAAGGAEGTSGTTSGTEAEGGSQSTSGSEGGSEGTSGTNAEGGSEGTSGGEGAPGGTQGGASEGVPGSEGASGGTQGISEGTSGTGGSSAGTSGTTTEGSEDTPGSEGGSGGTSGGASGTEDQGPLEGTSGTGGAPEGTSGSEGQGASGGTSAGGTSGGTSGDRSEHEQAPTGERALLPAVPNDAAQPPAGEPEVAAEEASGAPTDTLAGVFGSDEERSSADFAAGPASAGALVGIPVLTSASETTCELSAFVGSTPSRCTAGWSGAEHLLLAPPVGFTSAGTSVDTATPAAPAGHGQTGSALGGSPAGPGPGPAPSGASGGSAVGATGLALSGFLTLAGLLMLGGPRAMRRLRLSCEPWLTACFVLIPERPG